MAVLGYDFKVGITDAGSQGLIARVLCWVLHIFRVAAPVTVRFKNSMAMYPVRDVAFLRQACERATQGHCPGLDTQLPYFQGAQNAGRAPQEKKVPDGAAAVGIRCKVMDFLQDAERLGNRQHCPILGHAAAPSGLPWL